MIAVTGYKAFFKPQTQSGWIVIFLEDGNQVKFGYSSNPLPAATYGAMMTTLVEGRVQWDGEFLYHSQGSQPFTQQDLA
jgi:hypothetical protein